MSTLKYRYAVKNIYTNFVYMRTATYEEAVRFANFNRYLRPHLEDSIFVVDNETGRCISEVAA